MAIFYTIELKGCHCAQWIQMSEAMSSRKRGRPEQGSVLSEDAILDAALVLFEGERTAFSMRSLARHLQVDVMALYHYFPTKRALLDAAILTAFAQLNDPKLTFNPKQELGVRLETLASLYLDTARRYPGLTLEIIAGRVPAQVVVTRFDALFTQAFRPLELGDEDVRHAGHVLVDYLHGFMLSGEPGEAWRFGVRILALGLQHPQL